MAITVDRVRIARLRETLHAAGFTAHATAAALGREVGAAARSQERPVLLRRAAKAEPALRVALELFVLEEAVAVDTLEQALAPLRPDDLVELGLAEESGGMLRATIRLVPHEPFLVASDRMTGATRADLVTGVTRPATLLSQLTVRRPVRRALDVGTGNGILALLCARHAEQVVATDINEHALELAELNMALNGVTNVELRLGSFLEPVEGERFGLVVSNPPYVISPESEYLFRDAGLGGDRLSEQVVRLLPDALEEDGYASVTISWIAGSDDVAARPQEWLADTGCDAWLLHTTTDDPLTTASMWNRDIEDDPERYAAQIDRWVDWYRTEGIEALAYGVCVLRRRFGGDTWLRAAKLPNALVQSGSDHLLRLFAAQDRLAAGSLANAVIVPAPDAVLRHSLHPNGSGWSATGTELALDGGLGFTAALDGPSAAVVSALDGRPLQEVIAGARANIDVNAEEFDAAALTFVGRLLELGFVVAP